MSRLHDTILACALAEVTSRTEWDEPPALYFLRVERGEAALIAVPLPEVVWRMGPVADVLESMARDAGELVPAYRGAMPSGLYGAGFRAEAWEVVTDQSASKAKRARDHRDAWTRRISERPDRTEIRTLTVVDRAGITYSAAVRRNGETEAHILYRTVGTMVGAVPDALDHMVTALLGVELGTRPDAPDEAFWRGESDD